MRREAIIAVFAGVAALFFFVRARASNIEDGDDVSLTYPDTVPYSGEADQITGGTVDPNTNLLAFLAMIRKFETNDDYSKLYGGGHFSSFADHPRVKVPINLPGYESKYSSAAGAYQFLQRTWDNLAAKLGLADFSPASQDAAAVELLNEIGALQYVYAGDFDRALRLASSQWASLPYSQAKQNPQSIAAANSFLETYLSNVG